MATFKQDIAPVQTPNLTVVTPQQDNTLARTVEGIGQIADALGKVNDMRLVKKAREENDAILLEATAAADELQGTLTQLGNATNELNATPLSAVDTKVLTQKRDEVLKLVNAVKTGALAESSAKLRLDTIQRDFGARYPHLIPAFNSVRELAEHSVTTKYNTLGDIGSIASAALKAADENPALKGLNQGIQEYNKNLAETSLTLNIPLEDAGDVLAHEKKTAVAAADYGLAKLRGDARGAAFGNNLAITTSTFDANIQKVFYRAGIKGPDGKQMSSEDYISLLAAERSIAEQEIRAKEADEIRRTGFVDRSVTQQAIQDLNTKFDFFKGLATNADAYNKIIQGANRSNVTNLWKLANKYGDQFPSLNAILGTNDAVEASRMMQVFDAAERSFNPKTTREEFVKQLGAEIKPEEKANLIIAHDLIATLHAEGTTLPMFLQGKRISAAGQPVAIDAPPASADPVEALVTGHSAAVAQQPLATEPATRKVQVDNILHLARSSSQHIYTPNIQRKLQDKSNKELQDGVTRITEQGVISAQQKIPEFNRVIDTYKIDDNAIRNYHGEPNPQFFSVTLKDPAKEVGKSVDVQASVGTVNSVNNYVRRVNYLGSLYRMTHTADETVEYMARLAPTRNVQGSTYVFDPVTNSIKQGPQ